MKLACLLIATLLAAAPALARDKAPEPSKTVPLSFYSGIWYEIARTDNDRQKGCEAPTYQFTAQRNAATRGFVLTCRKGAPDGKPETVSVTMRVPADAARNKFTVTLMGVIRQEYWVLDRAEDDSWAIMGTPGGNYVWLLARRPNLDAGLKSRLMSRLRELGYDMGKIVQPRHG